MQNHFIKSPVALTELNVKPINYRKVSAVIHQPINTQSISSWTLGRLSREARKKYQQHTVGKLCKNVNTKSTKVYIKYILYKIQIVAFYNPGKYRILQSKYI